MLVDNRQIREILDGFKIFAELSVKYVPSFSSLSDCTVAMYGVGECSHWFHEIAMIKHNVMPFFVVDRKHSRGKWHGLDVQTPQEFARQCANKKDIHIIVCVGNFKTYDEIRTSLLSAGFNNIWFLAEFFEIHSELVTAQENSNKCNIANQREVIKAFEMIAEEQSKEIFARFLQLHTRQKGLIFPKRPVSEQFFPSDVPSDKQIKNYVCCGSYDGENIRKLKKQNIAVQNIFCFEPDEKMLNRLQATASDFKSHFANSAIFCSNKAVSDHRGRCNFIASSGLGARICESGTDSVEVTTLDSELNNDEVDLISMDIEGEELKALKGAQQTIQRCKPDLGIAVYHHAEQIWEIPLYIKGLNPDYEFFLRNYTGYAAETILYARVLKREHTFS